MKERVLKDKSYNFALRVVKLNKYLGEDKKEFFLSKQILRSGTSIGADVVEGSGAESTTDFVHKLSISLKESFETEFRLNLLRDADCISSAQATLLIEGCQELEKMLTTLIKTAKLNKNKQENCA